MSRYLYIAIISALLAFASYVLAAASADDNMSATATRLNDISFVCLIVFAILSIVGAVAYFTRRRKAR